MSRKLDRIVTKLGHYFGIISKDGFLDIKPCKNCYYPRKTMDDEIAIINGREVRIENYINRNQEIGK